MTELMVGGLRFVSHGTGVAVWRSGEAAQLATLDGSDVDLLIEYLVCLTFPGGNRRQLFRVPLWPDCGLSVQIEIGDRCFPAAPRNISLTGLQIELAEPSAVSLALDDRLKVILELDGATQTRIGVVRRRTDRGYGLLFVESLETEDILPPPALADLVMQLQRRWSARRRSLT